MFNPRGVGVPQITTHIFDYSLVLQDLEDFMAHIYATFPNSNVYFVGVSLGASLGVKYLGAHKEHSRVKGMVSIANPFSVYKAAASANSFKHSIYGRFLVRNLYNKVMFNKKAIEEYGRLKNISFDYEKIRRSPTTFDFDKNFTFTILSQYNDSAKYYELFSCEQDVQNVDVPMLFIHSKNDPISLCPKQLQQRAGRADAAEAELYSGRHAQRRPRGVLHAAEGRTLVHQADRKVP